MQKIFRPDSGIDFKPSLTTVLRFILQQTNAIFLLLYSSILVLVLAIIFSLKILFISFFVTFLLQSYFCLLCKINNRKVKQQRGTRHTPYYKCSIAYIFR